MKFLIICFASILISCIGSSQEQSKPAAEGNKTSNKRSCLTEITDPEKWYSIRAVASLVKVPEDSIEQKVYESKKQPSCSYHWKTDRTYVMKAGHVEMEVPVNNVIVISIINLDDAIESAEKMHKGRRTFTYAEYFDSYHSQVTKEDQKTIDEVIQKKGEEDKDFDAKTAKKIFALAPTEDYSEIQNLGDEANKYIQLAPGLREIRLAVLHGNVALLISVDIADEDAEDLAAAKTVAQDIIAKCD